MDNQQICSICGVLKSFSAFRRRGHYVDKICVECKRDNEKHRKTFVLRPSRVIEPEVQKTTGPLRGVEPSDPLKNIDLNDYSVWEEAAGRELTEDEKPEIKRNLNALASVLDRILARDENESR